MVSGASATKADKDVCEEFASCVIDETLPINITPILIPDLYYEHKLTDSSKTLNTVLSCEFTITTGNYFYTKEYGQVDYDSKYVELVSSEFFEPTSGLCGDYGHYIYTFKALKPGETIIQLHGEKYPIFISNFLPIPHHWFH